MNKTFIVTVTKKKYHRGEAVKESKNLSFNEMKFEIKENSIPKAISVAKGRVSDLGINPALLKYKAEETNFIKCCFCGKKVFSGDLSLFRKGRKVYLGHSVCLEVNRI